MQIPSMKGREFSISITSSWFSWGWVARKSWKQRLVKQVLWAKCGSVPCCQKEFWRSLAVGSWCPVETVRMMEGSVGPLSLYCVASAEGWTACSGVTVILQNPPECFYLFLIGLLSLTQSLRNGAQLPADSTIFWFTFLKSQKQPHEQHIQDDSAYKSVWSSRPYFLKNFHPVDTFHMSELSSP